MIIDISSPRKPNAPGVLIWHYLLLQDVLQFVGWELIGVICPAFVDNIPQDGFQECKRILKFIAEVRRCAIS